MVCISKVVSSELSIERSSVFFLIIFPFRKGGNKCKRKSIKSGTVRNIVLILFLFNLIDFWKGSQVKVHYTGWPAFVSSRFSGAEGMKTISTTSLPSIPVCKIVLVFLYFLCCVRERQQQVKPEFLGIYLCGQLANPSIFFCLLFSCFSSLAVLILA